MLSALSRGYSTWNGELDVYGETQGTKNLPEVGPGEHERHKHGVTVTPRTGRGVPYPHPPQLKEDGCLELPKTFLTRKGALLLFAAPDAAPQKDHMRTRISRKPKKQELIDLSLKLGTLERLSLSVLQYGDQGFDREDSSISDKENRWFLKFMHKLQPSESDPIQEVNEGDPLTDHHAQPGGDLKFYLNDLKQRASSRCYGRESSLSNRARSQELQAILQQLEEAWPSGHPYPLSQAPTSMSDGSFLGSDEFFYPPRSPSISSESSRAFSGRSKVLSSHKLTASLKSLNYLGRPASTEPGEHTCSVTSPDLALPPAHLSHTRRSKSGFWSGTAKPPEIRKQPGSSFGSRMSYSAERPLVTSPDLEVQQEENGPIIEEEPGDGRSSSGSRAISVQVSSPLGFVTEGTDPAPLSKLEEEADADRTSLSSSVQQEEDILLPSDGEEAEGSLKENDWPEDAEEQITEGEDGLARPLQPQYSGVLQEDSEMLQNLEDDQLRKSEHDELMAEGADQGIEISQQKMDDYLLNHVAKQLENQAEYATSTFSGSVDHAERDPETMVSLQGPGTSKSSSSVKSSTEAQSEVLQGAAPAPEPKAADASSVVSEPKIPSAAPTPEPKVADVTPASVEAAQPEAETVSKEQKEEPAPAVLEVSEQLKDSVSNKTEEVEDGKPLSDADMMSMAMSEAGFGVFRSGLSRSASPAPPSEGGVPGATFTLPTEDQEPAEAPKLVTPKTVLEKVGDVKKMDVKAPQPPAKKPPVTPRQRSPAKGGKAEKKEVGKKTIVKALDITSVQPDPVKDAAPAAESTTKAKEIPKEKKKESYRPPPPPARSKTPAEKQDLHIPEHMREAMARSSTAAHNELENELMKMHKAMDDTLGVSSMLTEDAEGLTEEELEQAQQALKERLEEAQRRMQEAVLPGAENAREKRPSVSSPRKAEGKGKKSKKARVVVPKEEEDKAKKEEAKEQRRLERLKRLEEAQALQALITQKEGERKTKEADAVRKAQELEEQVEILREEEESIMLAEEDAREQLAALRKTQREEREIRRKVDLEKKKQQAQQRRDKERQMMEAAQKKEQEMLDRIADSEMRRRMREEEDRRRDEEERLAQERYEEEVAEAQTQAEDEERRLQELEKQAEEEAFRRINKEREDAARQREELENEAKQIAEDEERSQQELLAVERRLREERLRQEVEEEKRMEEERQRLEELHRLEEEAREKMRAEIDQRRQVALKRREVNVDRRRNLDGLRNSQGMTDPWIYSYFVHWSRENYSRPMGEAIEGKKGGKKKPAKKK
ncbi:apical junction molecule ajm-1-like isoform X2 [Littorina saxatilis]|uniref:apical junction molecule ajm-1-like isoform X2 n=1 Tax=Littorina saxatilis TaxID=31220 RepID=UPI0038B58915